MKAFILCPLLHLPLFHLNLGGLYAVIGDDHCQCLLIVGADDEMMVNAHQRRYDSSLLFPPFSPFNLAS